MIEILLTIIGLNFFYSLPFFLSLVLNERQYWFVGLASYRRVCVCWICCCRQYYCFSPLSFLFIFAHSLIAQYLFEFPLCNIFLYSFVKRSCLRLCAAIAFWLCPYASACISFFFRIIFYSYVSCVVCGCMCVWEWLKNPVVSTFGAFVILSNSAAITDVIVIWMADIENTT